MLNHLTESSPKTWLWSFCICAGMLVYFTQVTVLFPVLPLYVTQRWQDVGVGFVVGAMAAGLLLFRPLIGWLIDHWGRKPVLWLGLGLMVVVLPLYGWSPDPTWLMGVRVLHGISQAAFATASQTLLVDVVPTHRRTALLGYLAMSNTIGFSLGPMLGAIAFAHAGFVPVIGAMAGLTLLGFVLTLPLPWKTAASSEASSAAVSNKSSKSSKSSKPSKPSKPSKSGELAPEKAAFPWNVILQFPVRDATLLFFIGSFLHGAVVTFLPLLVSNAAVFYSLNALVAVLVRFALGRWGNRVSPRWVVSVGILCSGIGLVGVAIAPTLLILWSVVYGLGFGLLFPVLSSIVSFAAPLTVRGRVYSVFLAGFDSGMTLGGAGVQPLSQIFPLSVLFLMLGGLGCSISGLAFRQFSRPIERI
ncbi:MFS transporter [Thermoleptolyngbya sp. C42_A2020_037]|uniref:MFS transporter n=1 Tax=Thermoleptolyngbya sp. C42_A2020_037 TaxID=2747799 RepID=UPI0019E49D70|nr:MFS transporter [Thermoleptolyngbya sp. C42_A2020_037]MBF2086651.1 MFS transporter [Thermoleptolyngbya sp. C42_A2020_037]